MVWSHNDQWMVTGDTGGFVKYWQTNMNNVKLFQAHKDPVRGLRYSHSISLCQRLFTIIITCPPRSLPTHTHISTHSCGYWVSDIWACITHFSHSQLHKNHLGLVWLCGTACISFLFCLCCSRVQSLHSFLRDITSWRHLMNPLLFPRAFISLLLKCVRHWWNGLFTNGLVRLCVLSTFLHKFCCIFVLTVMYSLFITSLKIICNTIYLELEVTLTLSYMKLKKFSLKNSWNLQLLYNYNIYKYSSNNNHNNNLIELTSLFVPVTNGNL